MKKKALYIVLSVLILSLLMSFIDGFIKPPYLIKFVVKIVLFLIVPMVYFALYKEERKQFKELFIPKTKDFSFIAGSLTADVGVSAEYFEFTGENHEN